MPFPLIPIVIGIGIVYMSGGYSKKYSKKKKEPVDYDDGVDIDDAIDEAETEGRPVIVWGDIDNCTDWYVTEQWLAQVAQPRFDQWIAVAEDEGNLDLFRTSVEAYEIAMESATFDILSGQLPDGCPEPEGDVFLLQVDYPDQANYYDGSQSVLYLYQDVHNAIRWAFEDIEAGGPGLLYAE